jgi:hypothetical protein
MIIHYHNPRHYLKMITECGNEVWLKQLVLPEKI